jgi:hypothetical protein
MLSRLLTDRFTDHPIGAFICVTGGTLCLISGWPSLVPPSCTPHWPVGLLSRHSAQRSPVARQFPERAYDCNRQSLPKAIPNNATDKYLFMVHTLSVYHALKQPTVNLVSSAITLSL